MPVPPRTRPGERMSASQEERVVASFLHDLTAVAHRIASDQGEPPQSKPINDAEKVKNWGLRDRLADPAILLLRLLATGLGPEEAQQMAIVGEWPELADLYANPAPDHETADQLIRLAEFPFRRGILADLEDDPEAWTKEAERIERLWNKSQPSLSADEAPGIDTSTPPAIVPADAPPTPGRQFADSLPTPPAPMTPAPASAPPEIGG